MFEMLVGRSPFDIGEHDQPDQNTEDYLFQGEPACMSELLFNVVLCLMIFLCLLGGDYAHVLQFFWIGIWSFLVQIFWRRQ